MTKVQVKVITSNVIILVKLANIQHGEWVSSNQFHLWLIVGPCLYSSIKKKYDLCPENAHKQTLDNAVLSPNAVKTSLSVSCYLDCAVPTNPILTRNIRYNGYSNAFVANVSIYSNCRYSSLLSSQDLSPITRAQLRCKIKIFVATNTMPICKYYGSFCWVWISDQNCHISFYLGYIEIVIQLLKIKPN